METAPPKRLQGSRVLVAEDEKALREAGAEILRPALSLARALELATAECLNCAVLDVMLRGGSVFRVARLLRQQGAGLVFYTGYFDSDLLKLTWPGAQILLKPASPSLLGQAVTVACSQ